jgi:hypothetical protein
MATVKCRRSHMGRTSVQVNESWSRCLPCGRFAEGVPRGGFSITNGAWRYWPNLIGVARHQGDLADRQGDGERFWRQQGVFWLRASSMEIAASSASMTMPMRG